MLLFHISLQSASDVAQLVIAVGVIGSAYLSVRALREVQRDRVQRQAPYLAFDSGGMQLRVQFVKAGKAIPGLNPAWVATVLPNLPADAESVRLVRGDGGVARYGKLHNLGAGPAIDTSVTWLAEKIGIGNEEFAIEAAKRAEPVYAEALNKMPAGLLKPGDTGELSRLPTFIEKDIDKKLTSVDGVLRIACSDVAGKPYAFEQEFHVFPNYTGDPPFVHVTFGRVLLPEANDDTT